VRLSSIGIGSVLVASIALNVWQWRREPASSTRRETSRDAPPATPAGVAAIVAGTCTSQLGALASQLAKVNEQLGKDLKYLPPRDAFERSALDPSREGPIRDALAKLFADAPKGWSWQVECRGSVCKLDVVGPDGGDPYDWEKKVQQGPLRDEVVGMGFSAGVPSQDPVSKDPLVSYDAFMTLAPAGTVSGNEILQQILARFRADLDKGACPSNETGSLTVQLRLDPLARQVNVAAGGTLAVTPVGTCMLRDLDAAIAADPVPDNARSAMVHYNVDLPLTGSDQKQRRPDDRRLARRGT